MLFHKYFFQFNRMDETHFKLLKKIHIPTVISVLILRYISLSLCKIFKEEATIAEIMPIYFFKNFLIAVYDNNLETHKRVSANSIFLEFVRGLFHSGVCMQALVFPYVCMKHTRVSR